MNMPYMEYETKTYWRGGVIKGTNTRVPNPCIDYVLRTIISMKSEQWSRLFVSRIGLFAGCPATVGLFGGIHALGVCLF